MQWWPSLSFLCARNCPPAESQSTCTHHLPGHSFSLRLAILCSYNLFFYPVSKWASHTLWYQIPSLYPWCTSEKSPLASQFQALFLRIVLNHLRTEVGWNVVFPFSTHSMHWFSIKSEKVGPKLKQITELDKILSGRKLFWLLPLWLLQKWRVFQLSMLFLISAHTFLAIPHMPSVLKEWLCGK